MADSSSLEALQSLHRDLVDLSESRLPNIERLWAQLENRIEDFRKLLDKPARNEQSRKSLAAGKLKIDDDEYAINAEFQQEALQLADALDLDEVAAAQTLLEAQGDVIIIGRSNLECGIIRYHQQRKYLLECLRLVLHLALDPNLNDDVRGAFQHVVKVVLQVQESSSNASKFLQKCLAAMGGIKSNLQGLADKLNSATVLGEAQRPELAETLEYQRVSLIQQHESLGMIIYCLVRTGHATVEDMEKLLGILKKADKYDNLLALTAFISAFGSPDGRGTFKDARALNEIVVNKPEQDGWTLHYIHSAVSVWWLAEYSGWFLEGTTTGPLPENTEEDNKRRADKFTHALKDGAFDFLLSLSSDTKSTDWYDPARHGLRQWLQRKAPPLIPDTVPFAACFQQALMEQLEIFIDAFITNLPDVLRKLRVDEDEQRQLSQTHEHDLDLERFLVIISFAFEGRPDAAQAFWSDPDSNLAGFLHWASRRASTPLVSAFCEMLQALAEDEECADAAHEFLLDEAASSSAKMKRSHSLSWSQIFKELDYFSSKIRNRPALPQSHVYRTGKPSADHAETEPESAMMLESYLRLIKQLCSHSKSVRDFLIQHPTFHLVNLLLQLAGSLIPSRLRACAFAALESLLTQKTRTIGNFIWASIDGWLSGGYAPTTNQPNKAPIAATSLETTEGILREVRVGFEEPTAFVRLLIALMCPYEEDAGLNDALPFPESLGAENRMPGVDPYVDFAVGDIFRNKSAEASDIGQLRLVRLACLDFILTCLTSFNEDLVVFANQTNVAVEKAMKASSLASYVQLHPFARVMEWLFNEKVLMELFEVVRQDVTEIGNASPDSPQVLCLMRGIQVLTCALDLQSTYLDIVRPLIKTAPSHRRSNVPNAAFASFEDGVLTKLDVLVDLGLYCGAGHTELCTASLGLLHKLATSPRLVASSGGRGMATRNKLIAALESNNDWLPIARSLASALQPGVDFDLGPESPSYPIKPQTLDFLSSCIQASPGKVTIAHLLLGFQCQANELSVESGGAFANGESLFHIILNMTMDIPAGLPDTGCVSWLVSLKKKGMQLLKQLWSAPLSSAHVMQELRDSNALFLLFVKEPVVDLGTPFDGRGLVDEMFFGTSSAACLADFLYHRSLVLRYTATELRQVTKGHSHSLKKRIFATLQGSTTVDGEQQIANSSIFDYFDFMELEVPQRPIPPELNYFRDLDVRVCMNTNSDGVSTYDLSKVEQILVLRRNELRSGDTANIQLETLLDAEAQAVLNYLLAENQINDLVQAKLSALEAWVQLVMVMVTAQTDSHDTAFKISFVIQTLKTILPKLEKASLNYVDEAMLLARLARELIFSIDFQSSSFQEDDMGNQASNSLFDLFRLCLRAIHSPISSPPVRETYYSICFRFLIGMSDVSKSSGLIRQHSTRTIKSAGDRLMDVICDDAYSGDHTCRLAALLLLGCLVALGRQDESTYVIEAFVRLNFVGILVDSIRDILPDLQRTATHDLDMQTAYYNAKLALLVQICEIRYGATAVLEAGFFQAVRESDVFSTDPDLRDDLNDSSSTRKFFELLASVMRVVNAAVFTRGPQNEYTIGLGRQFLTENRSSILAVFKKSVGVGMMHVDAQDAVSELADMFMLLITMTGFLDDQGFKKAPSVKAFT